MRRGAFKMGHGLSLGWSQRTGICRVLISRSSTASFQRALIIHRTVRYGREDRAFFVLIPLPGDESSHFAWRLTALRPFQMSPRN